MTIPALMITFNRLEFTKKSLEALFATGCPVTVIDNGSEDGTVEYLRSLRPNKVFRLIINEENKGIAYAMNQFLESSIGFEYCIKCDNDTILPHDFCARMLPHMANADVVQARHPIIKATNPNGWEGFTRGMKKKGSLLFNSFIGGSGIMFKRKLVNHIPETEWKLGGFREWQRQHPEAIKAFAEDCEIILLDTDENGANYPEEYLQYYKSTGRL